MATASVDVSAVLIGTGRALVPLSTTVASAFAKACPDVDVNLPFLRTLVHWAVKFACLAPSSRNSWQVCRGLGCVLAFPEKESMKTASVAVFKGAHSGLGGGGGGRHLKCVI